VAAQRAAAARPFWVQLTSAQLTHESCDVGTGRKDVLECAVYQVFI
jgi:hypothetical protein